MRADTAAGTEAWLTAERDRLAELCRKTEARVDELSRALHQADDTRMEVQRLRVQLEFSQAEAREAIEDSSRCAAAANHAQVVFDARARAMRREAKEMKNAMVSTLRRQEKDKKRLLLAILDREQEEAAAATMTTLRQSATVPATTAGVAFGGAAATSRRAASAAGTGAAAAPSPSSGGAMYSARSDPISLLRQQQAAVMSFQGHLDDLIGQRRA